VVRKWEWEEMEIKNAQKVHYFAVHSAEVYHTAIDRHIVNQFSDSTVYA